MPTTKSKGRSRNSTPMSNASLDAPAPSSGASQPSTLTYDDILDTYCRSSKPPASATLRKIADALKICSDIAQANVDKCDRGMRDTLRRKQSLANQVRDQERDAEEEEAEEERTKERIRHEKPKQEAEEDRPLAVGAHALAPQDGSEAPELPVDTDLPHQPPEIPATTPARSDASSSSPAPPPKPAAPREQTFGPDPSTFDDPTVYEIHDITEDLPEQVKLDILGVTHYPHSDLHDLTCGTPPDRDFSNAKPANQVAATTFLNAIDPFVRALNPEDSAFLEERGDRVTPFEMPRKGTRSYKEVWAQEDGIAYTERHQNTVLEQDDGGDTGDLPAAGPMLARLLATMRPERRLPTGEGANAINGDNGGSVEPREQTLEPMQTDDAAANALPPATYLGADPTQPGWKNSTPRLDVHATDERVKQELRYIGFLSDDAEPDYDAHYDDEVAARLRYLQEELERVALRNGARKARVAELAEERMAKQEWSQISDDLDNQLNQGYLKRHRNSSKGKKNPKRPGGPGSGSHPLGLNGVARPGLGEPIRNLMDRRSQWNNMLGPVVEFGHTEIPTETIFDKASIDRHLAREKESWAEAQEQSG